MEIKQKFSNIWDGILSYKIVQQQFHKRRKGGVQMSISQTKIKIKGFSDQA